MLMPYKVGGKNLPSNVKGMSESKQKAWVATWNSVYDSCISDGGDKTTCEGKAFKIANGNAKKKKQERAWSGAASNYDSTEAYCSACLIDVNGSGAKTQENCKLPVKAAGSKSYDKDGVHAAAVRFGSVKKPSGVSADTWSSAVKSAANKLISAYSSFGETAPDSVYEAAGKTPPKGKKQSMEQKSLLRKAWKGIMDALFGSEVELPFVERSIALDRVYEQIWNRLDEMYAAGGDWGYPLNMYVGDNGTSLFSLVTQGGKIYQVPITVSQDTVTLGDWTQVMENFVPVTQSRFTVRRLKDGSHRWFGIAATAVINRLGEIDSSKLFDSFVQRINETGQYPTLDFYHMGESDSKTWDFGVADYVARDGCCYIASGTFYEDHPLAKAAIRVMSSDGSGEWGHSIEFYAEGEPEDLKIEPNVQIPVYYDGENTRISMVLEKDAAGLFTRMLNISQKEERSMNKKIEAALAKLFGDDEDAMQAFVENVDTVNRTVKDEKLIHRAKKNDPAEKDDDIEEDAGDGDEEDTEAGDADTDEEETEPQRIVLDEIGMKALVEQVSQSKEFGDLINPFRQTISDLQALVNELKTTNDTQTKDITRLKKTNEKLVERVNALSADENQKKQTWQQDLPARKVTQATYRPSLANQGDEDDEEDDDDFTVRAQRSLSNLPSY